MKTHMNPIFAAGAALSLVLAPGMLAATATLAPNGAGGLTNLALVHNQVLPVGLRTNWGVNTLDDGDTTYVWMVGGWNDDLYTLQDPASPAGTITSVTVYIKARAAAGGATQAGARTAVGNGTEVVYGTPVTLTDSYAVYSSTYASKPFAGGGAWTWADITSLQAGVSLQRSKPAPGAIASRCTLVCVVVEYTECQWLPETAWAAGTRYVDQGNWATYTAYAPGSTVTLWAGQTLNAGTVHFSAPVGGVVTVTITLNAGWRFQDVPENVKIQDYAAAPSGNPSPGGFATKGKATGSPFSINVPENNYYGVHVDVERSEPVPG